MQPCEKYSENRELIYLAQNSDEKSALKATETLINTNMGLVRSIAYRFRDRGVDMEDLVQIGTIGMIKAIRSFELCRETTFSTYAVPLIIGEIRRHLRDDGLIKVSRYHKKLGMELMNARNKIVGEDGREPQIEELAQICGVSSEDAAMALDAASPIVSLSSTVNNEETTLTLESRLADNDNEIEKASDRIALSQAISKMPPVWRQIVVLRYYKDMTQQETASVLGISQVKVSREEKKIMAFLKDELAV